MTFTLVLVFALNGHGPADYRALRTFGAPGNCEIAARDLNRTFIQLDMDARALCLPHEKFQKK